MADTLLEVEDLTVKYSTPDGPLTAVSNASFTVDEGRYFGLVGESGCGKSTIAKALMGGLDANGTITSGTIRYKGRELQDMSEKELRREIRWKEISWIPQSSMNSLDPIQRIGDQAVEIANTHTDLSTDEALSRIEEMFEVVGIAKSRVMDYPHEFSGGMAQRAIIALALFLKPSFIIADEPTTALDVIMQDQVFKYLDEVKADNDTSMMLITHDISVVFESCDDMAVMHSGQIAESGTVIDIYDDPRHPYSILLQKAFPDVRHPNRELEVIEGQPPQSLDTVNYCTFADRCPMTVEECRMHEPDLERLPSGTDAHKAACFRTDESHRIEEYTNDDLQVDQ